MKKTRNDNFRVVVTPRMWPSIRPPNEDDYKSACSTIAAGIRRHIDDVGDVSIAWDALSECEHCGHRWTEASDNYNGGCCDLDEESNPETAADRTKRV